MLLFKLIGSQERHVRTSLWWLWHVWDDAQLPSSSPAWHDHGGI